MRFSIPLTALVLLAGCQPFAMPKEFQEASRAVAVSITDQAIWDDILASTDGHAINPGLEVEAGLKYFANARIVGVDGDIRLSAQGKGSGLQSEEAQALIRSILADGSNLDPAVRSTLEAILLMLQRSEPEGEVVPVITEDPLVPAPDLG